MSNRVSTTSAHAQPRCAPMYPDLTVVVVVREVEETVGRDVRRIVGHLRSLHVPFEVLAVADGTRDNSWALLTLLAAELPEVRLLPGARGRAFIRGVAEARGRTVVLWEADRCALPLLALTWALSRVGGGKHAVVMRGRCVIADRLGALPAVIRSTGRGDLWERAFERNAADLDIDVVGTRVVRAGGLLAPVLRFLAA